MRLFFFIFLLFVGALGLLLNYNNYQRSQTVLEQQAQERQLVIARAGAKSIELFMKSLALHLVTLSQVDSIASLDIARTRSFYEDLLAEYKTTPIVTMVRVNQNGTAVVVADKMKVTTGEGTNFSDRPYFLWAKNLANRGKFYLTSSFISRAGSSAGTMITAIVVPTYYHDKFTGLVGIGVSVDRFRSSFITSLLTTNVGEVLLINQNGEVIAGDAIEKNILLVQDGVQKTVDYTSWIQEAMTRVEGQASYIALRPSQDKQLQLASYHKVDIYDTHWLLIVTTRPSVFTKLLLPAYSNQAYGFILSTFGLLLAGILFVTIEDLAKRDGFLKGYQDGLDDAGKKKSKE